MNEIEPVEGMILVLDAPEHVYAAAGARVPLDCGTRIDTLEFLLVCGDADLVSRHHGNHREQRSRRSPALRAAAEVVMRSLPADRDGDLVGRAVARQRPPGEIGGGRGEAVIDRRMNLDLRLHFVPPSYVGAGRLRCCWVSPAQSRTLHQAQRETTRES